MGQRLLKPAEIAFAATVFGNKIPYARVYISDIDLGGAVTLGDQFVFVRDGKFQTEDRYCICWPAAYTSALSSPAIAGTLIHELTHVWQGAHGVYPAVYMGQSVIAQLDHGIRDIIRRREWRGWGVHRSTAYKFDPGEIGKNWSQFNVEQQASIVQSWFMKDANWSALYGKSSVVGGNSSPYDPRYPYISDVIRAGNRGANYHAVSLPNGGSADIKRIQDRLVMLRYLDPVEADGLLGRSVSRTLDAVAVFQKRNGLQVDRDLGGPNSLTRRKLLGNFNALVPAP
jgi:hypothetical protein